MQVLFSQLPVYEVITTYVNANNMLLTQQGIERVQAKPQKEDELPTNIQQVQAMRSYFSTLKSAHTRRIFKIGELQTIAGNLGLSSSGRKSVLIDRILTHAGIL